jgi:peptide/nickel transport system substrate-binding protein
VVALASAATALALRLTHSESVVLTTTTSYSEGVAGTWQRINPLFASTNEVDQDLSALVFSGLLRIGSDGRAEPDLAASLPDISTDGKSYTFHLRPDAKWQDGQPVTSADVAFTVAKLKDPDFKGDADLAEAWSAIDVETPDPMTAIFRLKQPSSPFLAREATIGLLPAHLLGTFGGTALFDAPFNAQPIGSGPYRLTSVDSQQAILTASDVYYLGKPQIDTFRVRFFGDYPSAMRALSGGELDGLLLRDTPTESQLTELGRLKGKKVEQLQRSAYLVLYLNNDQAAFFSDERVRRAISLTIDRRLIATRAFQGVGTPSESAIPPGTWAYAKEYDNFAPNVDEAKQLLGQAGWTVQQTTGVLTKDGQEFRLTIRTDNDPVRVAVAGEVQRQLEQVGIKATVAATTFSVLRRDFLQERKYDAAIAGFEQGPDPDPYFSWHSSQLGSAGLNLANFGDVVTDELIARARTAADADLRQAQYRQFQEKWDDLAPSVVLLYPRYIYVHPDGLKGFTPGVLFDGAQRFLDVQKWHT